MIDSQLTKRVEERIREWDIAVEETRQTQSSLIVFGRRASRPVVLKVLRQPGDEWRCGAVLNAFNGQGVVRCDDYIDGAVLLERLIPGTCLAELPLNGKDEEATEILADVVSRMSHPPGSLDGVPTVQDWGKGFQDYLASANNQIPRDLVEEARCLYSSLCASQTSAVLLHGDLQHYNVLFDHSRGWTAIDPKGVVGEIEYEVGASLRNPIERPEVFVSPKTVERRLRLYEAKLKLDSGRTLGWSFSQAVLSAIWLVEDGFAVDAMNPSIRLAKAVRGIMGEDGVTEYSPLR